MSGDSTDSRPAAQRGRRRVIVVAVSVVVLVLAAVALLVRKDGGRAGASVSPVPDERLQSYYTQTLAWTTCAEFARLADQRISFATSGFECAYLLVPADYSVPDRDDMRLAVLRQRAGQPERRIGSLVLNPGGPGASGVESAASLGPRIAGRPVGQRFDIVGFDPRGVGASRPPIQCLTGPERDAERLDLDVDNSAAGVAQTEAEARDLAAKCEQRSGGRTTLANVGTRDVIRDMDILRAALGEQKLTYLGYSYGTRLGYSYAEAYPDHVRAMVLDGALDPDQGFIDRVVAQNAGFQRAFDAFGRWCAGRPDCPLGADPARATQAYRQLVLPLIERPVPLPDRRKLSYPDALTGTTQALYAEQLWEPLRRGLAELAEGQGRTLMLLADLYHGRRADGGYEGIIDAFTAIGCVDDQPITDPQVVLEASRRVAEVAPFRDDGRGPNPARDACAFWPVPYTSQPHTPQVTGLPRLLVISVTGDPATPYQAGVGLAQALDARLLTVEGNQHTVALQGSECVDDHVSGYLINPGAVPPEGTRCVLPPA